MKGIIIFNSINDVSFMHLDNEIKSHIKSLAVKQGLLKVCKKNLNNLKHFFFSY